MKHRLVVSDIDGTLLAPGEVLSSRTIDLIHLFQEKGGIFTIATGRMEKAVLPLVQRIGLNHPVILYNGSLIMNPQGEEVIFEAKLEADIAARSLALSNAFDLGMLLYLEGVAYTKEMTSYIERHNQKEHVTCKVVDSFSPLLEAGLTKILFMGDAKLVDQLEQTHRQQQGVKFNVIRSEVNYLEVLPENASKGNALEWLASHLSIPLSETVAIGDERNDLSMIRQAQVGVAVNNAVKELKMEADLIVDGSYSTGVAEVLEKILAGTL